MQINQFSCKIIATQDAMYSKLNNFSSNQMLGGRVISIFAGVADGVLNIVKRIVRVVELVAELAINFFGSIYKENCTLNNAYIAARELIDTTCLVPAEVIGSILSIPRQIFLGLKDPTEVKSMFHNIPYSGSPRSVGRRAF